MEWLKRQSFTKLILTAIAFAVMPFAVLTYLTYVEIGQVGEATADMEEHLKLYEKAAELSIINGELNAAVYKLTGFESKEELAVIGDFNTRISKITSDLKQHAVDDPSDVKAIELVKTVETKWADYNNTTNGIVKRYTDRKYVTASFPKLLATETALDEALDNINADIQKDLEETAARVDESRAVVVNSIVKGIMVELAILALAMFFLWSNVLTRLKKTFVEFGSASKKLSSASQELAGNADAMNQTTEQITSAISQVATGAAEQSKGAVDAVNLVEQIAGAIGQVAQSAQTQVASVDEMATGINQLVDSINRVSESAGVVASVVEEASAVASKGKGAVDDTISGMDRIKNAVSESAYKIQTLGETSKQIGEIIEVIDDIAEQTNLLALNAAIEAARAGEHGRGFAVVADEVRKLAERSARATGEIADLIRSIQDETMEAVETMEKGTSEVESGSKLAENAGEAIEEMMSSIREVVNQIAQVSENADNMASASNQVSRAVEQIAAISEENSATAEEVSSSTNQVVSAVDSIAASSQESAASAEEVSATTEEQAASIEEMSAQVQSLAMMSEELDRAVASIKI